MITRYITYGGQFLLSLVIASKLGPFYLGVYGIINLILSYFGQINFGISHSLNIFLIHNKDNKKKFNAYFLNSLSIYIWLAILILVTYLLSIILGIKIKTNDYELAAYMPLIISIAILTYIDSLFTCVARVKNDLNTLTFATSLPVLLNSIIIWFFSGQSLVLALVVSNLVSYIVIFLWCCSRGLIPHWDKNNLNNSYKKEIINKGIFLFLYNSCFYFIIISIRTIISSNYPITEFGYFTFSYTVVHAVMLLIDSFNTIIFPKTISLLSTDNTSEIRNSLSRMRVAYTSMSHCLIYIALIVYPIFTVFMPKYSDSIQSMYLISLTVLMNTTSFGYSSLIIAKNKEKIAAKISFISLVLNILGGLILVYIFKVTFSFVILSTLVTYMFFAFMCTFEGERLIDGYYNLKTTLQTFFPVRLFLPYSIAVIVAIIENPYIMWLPLLIFIILNYKDLRSLITIANKLTKNPDIIDV